VSFVCVSVRARALKLFMQHECKHTAYLLVKAQTSYPKCGLVGCDRKEEVYRFIDTSVSQ
jgi:hypothetical protein